LVIPFPKTHPEQLLQVEENLLQIEMEIVVSIHTCPKRFELRYSSRDWRGVEKPI
jgi:hypothetical protein